MVEKLVPLFSWSKIYIAVGPLSLCFFFDLLGSHLGEGVCFCFPELFWSFFGGCCRLLVYFRFGCSRCIFCLTINKYIMWAIFFATCFVNRSSHDV